MSLETNLPCHRFWKNPYFQEILQWWRVVGQTVFNLIILRFESRTSRSSHKGDHARSRDERSDTRTTFLKVLSMRFWSFERSFTKQ